MPQALTIELLKNYSEAALNNAKEIVSEAHLLYSRGHRARAYFLGIAAIEEVGKALIAFDAQGRNLSDPGVCKQVFRSIEDHTQKITSAISAKLRISPNLRNDLMPSINLMIHLKHGREPSMYTDFSTDHLKIQCPSDVVSDKAGQDCVRLAKDCLSEAIKFMNENVPRKMTRDEDKVFALPSKEYKKIAGCEDFWWFHLSELESHKSDFATSLVKYRERFFLKGLSFKT